MRRGEEEARRELIKAVVTVVLADISGEYGHGVDESEVDRLLLAAAKDYVNTVVGPNFAGDRC